MILVIYRSLKVDRFIYYCKMSGNNLKMYKF